MPNLVKPPEFKTARLNMVVRGAVQGVGFRPYVYRLAMQLHLNGWIVNDCKGVTLEVEGPLRTLQNFQLRLLSERPAYSVIEAVESRYLASVGYQNFEIRDSASDGRKTAFILPDLVICHDCLEELFDPSNHRYRYPFINCTRCGPRFSIIRSLPYDRPNTTMADFAMCPQCREEYSNPLDRRFHAQPIACPHCGPRLEFRSFQTYLHVRDEAALFEAENVVVRGGILALKGLGGYQLIVAADNHEGIQRLRLRKKRDAKPFAIMCPDLESAREICDIDESERQLLLSAESPIVLLRKRSARYEATAPGLLDYGILLPYTPLHHLMMRDLGFSVVATSGNRSNEPICIDDAEAMERLKGIADAILYHNRPIVRPVDDSVARIVDGHAQVFRRARGFAPLPIITNRYLPDCLAVGAHLKNSVALSTGNRIFVSQHIGNLDTSEAFQAFVAASADLPLLYERRPDCVAHDKHPDYLSTQFAYAKRLPRIAVQHHLAHAYACMADNQLEPPVLAACWDGVGLGDDGVTWGGEFFLVSAHDARRVATLRTFPLIGGDAAALEPRRVGLALLMAAFPEIDLFADLPPLQALSHRERELMKRLANNPRVPMTSSMGRLFDGVASILGLAQANHFEGQAAMLLEAEADRFRQRATPYRYTVDERRSSGVPTFWTLDWTSTIVALVHDLRSGAVAAKCAARFQATLVAMLLDIAKRAAIETVALSGGCFQNRSLTEKAIAQLRQSGFKPFWHQRVPPNDGGIAVGQAYAAGRPSAISVTFSGNVSSKRHSKVS